MTFRAVVIGLACVAAICSVTYFNDFVIYQTHFIGNYMPISVFGLLVILVLAINPLLKLIRARLLNAGELAVIVALCLSACYVPGRGLMHYFGTFLMMPHQYIRTNISWRKHQVLEITPRPMLADPNRPGVDPDKALAGFQGGLAQGDEHIAFSEIPWGAWTQTLVFWLPLLITISIAMIALATVIHRQWTRHERLRYPIAEFAGALLPRAGQTVADVFRTRGFWVTAVIIMSIHVVNYLHQWYPKEMIEIPMRFDFRPLLEYLDTLRKGGGQNWGLLNFQIWFTAVGFAYFLATDLSFSLGIAPYVYAYVTGIFAIHGIQLAQGGFLSLRIDSFLHGGAYFGMFGVLLYTGRRYYWTTLRGALCLPVRQREQPAAIWGMRVFLIGSALFAAQLVLVGLDWQLAVAYTLGAVIILTVVSRVVCEGGVFYIHAYTFPCALLWGFLGAEALGPRPLLIMMMVSSLLLIDPREAVMPYMAHGLRLCDMNGVKVGRTALAGTLSLLLAFAVALPVTLYWQYDRGVNRASDGWTRSSVPRFTWDATANLVQKLKLRGTLEEASAASGWGRLTRLHPNRQCVIAFGVALGLVLLFTLARLRFPGWPFHPVIFLVLGTWQSTQLAASFMLGCLIKVAVTRIAGSKSYQRAKPIMIGMIAGDVIGGIIPMIAGGIYYYATGLTPETYRVLPT